jgi:hypothetical protein
MVWYLIIPVFAFYTFKNLYQSGFPQFAPTAHRNFLEWVFLIVMGSVISSVLSLVPVGLSCFVGSLPDCQGVANPPYPLVTLREKDGQSGRFFLGSGSINDMQYYFWYRRNPDGSVSGGKTTRQPGVRIFEDDKFPHMVTFHTEYKSPLAQKYLWLVGTDIRDDSIWCPDFYLPKGSVREGFEL